MKKKVSFHVGPFGSHDTVLAGEVKEDGHTVMTISFQTPCGRPSPEAFQMLVDRMRKHVEEA